MRIPTTLTALVLAVALAGCCQGPGHTRAFGTLAGTAAGAALGAAASPCCPGGGALVGAGLGMIGGAIVGDAVASDQERCGCDPCCPPRCAPCPTTRCAPCPPTRRTVIRRKVYIVDEQGVRHPAEEVVEEVVETGGDFGYRGR